MMAILLSPECNSQTVKTSVQTSSIESRMPP